MKRALSPSHRQNIGKANHLRFIEQQDRVLLARIADRYQSGESIQAISADIGKGQATVWRWLRQAGVPLRRRGSQAGSTWSPARREHHPEKPPRDPDAPRGYEILVQRALGNKSRDARGYIVVNLGRGERQYEHILVAEKALGRPLGRGEVVHHINCVRDDNRPENLLVCTISYHVQLHARMRRHPYWSQIEARGTTSK